MTCAGSQPAIESRATNGPGANSGVSSVRGERFRLRPMRRSIVRAPSRIDVIQARSSSYVRPVASAASKSRPGGNGVPQGAG